MTGRTIISTVLILIVIFTALESARRIHNQNLDITLFYASAAKSPDDQPHEARVLSAQDLLRRPLATNLTTVPKIFHQSWSTSTLPIKFEKWSRSCGEVRNNSSHHGLATNILDHSVHRYPFFLSINRRVSE